MQEPVREFYRGFDIQLILRHREEDARIETIVFIDPCPRAGIAIPHGASPSGFRTIHEPGDDAPIASQMEQARRVIDAAIGG
jgi:hypothetical protein